MSSLICLASWTSFCMMVTLFTCNAQRLDCSSKPPRNVFPASCNANIAVDCNLRSSPTFLMISFTILWKGNLLINISVLLWYFFISFSALRPLLIFLVLSSFSFSCLDFSSFLVFFTFIFFTHCSFSFLNFFLSAFVGVLLILHAISAQ